MTVEQTVRDWLANLPAEIKAPVSVRLANTHGERIIRALGGVRLHDLRVSRVESFLRAMAADGYSASVISQTRSVLVRSIRRAQRDDKVSKNVAELARCPAARTRKSKSMTEEQVRQLLGSGLDTFWTAYMITAIECGMRPGEITGLTWDDVDFEENTITITHSLKRVDGKLRLADLKTEWSGGVLTIPARTRAALLALQETQDAERQWLGEHYGGLGTVFCINAGRPMSRQLINTKFKNVTEATGLGRDWQPRETRHTTVSLLDDAGQPIEDISALVRHKNSQVTRVVYRHQISNAPAARTAATMDGIDLAASGETS